jgi:hypothetical protein
MILRLTALALTALILMPSGAHLFELPGKIGLDRDAYFRVQAIYAGWAFFAIPIFAALAANGALYFAERGRDSAAARAALVSCILIVASLAVFFIWVFPGNRTTANWTDAPENWQVLRRHWEYGHAASAVLVFGALMATGRAIMGPRPTE